MKLILIAGPVLVAGVFAGAIFGESTEPKIFRHADADGADAASGRLLLRVPGTDSAPGNDVPKEAGEPPAEPSDVYDDEDGATFFGEQPKGNRIGLLLDVSKSMGVRDGGSAEDADGNIVANPRRCDLVGIETVKLLRALEDEAAVAIIEFGGNDNHWSNKQVEPPTLTVMDGDDGLFLCMANGGREKAIEFINSTITQLRLGTPTYSALKRACENCKGMTDFYVLTDGAPTNNDTRMYKPANRNWDYPIAQEQILSEFSGWWEPYADNCNLTCFKIGDNSNAADFLQTFTATYNGKYIDR